MPYLLSLSVRIDNIVFNYAFSPRIRKFVAAMASAVGGSELENNATPTDETTKVVTAMGPRSGSSPQLTVQDDGENYPSGPKFWLICAALGLGGFLVSFVRNSFFIFVHFEEDE